MIKNKIGTYIKKMLENSSLTNHRLRVYCHHLKCLHSYEMLEEKQREQSTRRNSKLIKSYSRSSRILLGELIQRQIVLSIVHISTMH